jgi:AraC-like DNA-binding protein
VGVWCAGIGLVISGVCPVEQRGWTNGPPQSHHRVLFVRCGAFLRRLNGVEVLADSTWGSVVRPGDDMQVAHPMGRSDLFTILQLPDDPGGMGMRPGDFTVSDELDLAHRRLVAAATRGADRLELGERVAAILERVPTEVVREEGPIRAAHRRLAVEATELLAVEGFSLGLDGIAGRLGCSPHHLSRVFRRVTGQTLTGYRNRVRVREVLADLQAGEGILRELAARYGFVDQAHMIRVVRRHAGDSPGTLQKMLRA